MSCKVLSHTVSCVVANLILRNAPKSSSPSVTPTLTYLALPSPSSLALPSRPSLFPFKSRPLKSSWGVGGAL